MYHVYRILSLVLYSIVLYFSCRQGNLLYTACISLLAILVYSLLILERRIVVQNIYYEISLGEEESDIE